MPMGMREAHNLALKLQKEGRKVVRTYSWNNSGDDGTWLIDDRTDEPQTIREKPKRGKR